MEVKTTTPRDKKEHVQRLTHPRMKDLAKDLKALPDKYKEDIPELNMAFSTLMCIAGLLRENNTQGLHALQAYATEISTQRLEMICKRSQTSFKHEEKK